MTTCLAQGTRRHFLCTAKGRCDQGSFEGLPGLFPIFWFVLVFIGYQFRIVSLGGFWSHFGSSIALPYIFFVSMLMGVAILNFVLVINCPVRSTGGRQTRSRKHLLRVWRRVVFRIILRKRAGKLFGQVGYWLRATKGQCALRAPHRPVVASNWSRLGGLLNNHPAKVTGSPSNAEIQRSILRCRRQR